MDEKTCSKCKQSLPSTAFYRNPRWRDGFHPWCKACIGAAGKARYEKRCAELQPHHRWHRDAVRHDYFAQLTQSIQAYILGLLAADGNVLGSVPRISLEISVKDEDLLTLVRDELAPEHRIRFRERKTASNVHGTSKMCGLTFTSAAMVADLARFGIVPAKSHILRWPTTLAQEWARDFLLGYFDGDGHVTYTFNGGHRYAVWGLTSGTPDFLWDVIEVVRIHTGITLGGPYPKGGRGYAARLTGLRALALDAWLHESGLGLARKRFSI